MPTLPPRRHGDHSGARPDDEEEAMIPTDTQLVLHRHYPASRERLWNLWTTAAGISSWWGPEGFSTSVEVLDLRPGGELVYTMTATGREQIAYLERAGMPRSTRSRKEFVDVDEPSRLAYTSTIDFVPGLDPYQHLTTVTLEYSPSGTDVTMMIEALHDEAWTERVRSGRSDELDNLARVVARASARGDLRRY
jgi:uncharacterized protein YndB with AHSA1/START domain